MSRNQKNTAKVIAVYLGIITAFISYEFFNKLTPLSDPIVMRGWLDAKVPIIPAFLFPYLSFHILAAFVVPWISLRVGGFQLFLINGLAIIVSQVALDIAYFFFQTEVPRPTLDDHGLNSILIHLVWGNDHALNGFPSNHVAWSVVSIIALWRLRKRIPKLAWSLILWFGLIIPSTVFVGQHFLVDIYGGVFVAFSVYWAVTFKVEKHTFTVE